MVIGTDRGSSNAKRSKDQALVQRVRKALSDDLRKPGQKSGCPSCGHCYVASEALWHLLGGKGSGWTPQSGPAPGGGTHWWLKHDDGRILDATEDQFKGGYDHSQGTGRGFLTAKPSKRARTLMDRVGVRRKRKRGAANTTSTGYHVTAIGTSGASAPLRHLLSSRPSWVKGKVLDFGTGRGRDCKALKKRGISVSCYDPHHPKPSMTQLPSGRFGLVLATYVVNVLPPKERRAAIRRMGSKVAPKGRLVVAARGCGDAGGRQTAASWTKHADGHQDDDGRFQRFFGPEELASQVKAALGSGWTRCELPQGDRGFAMTAWRRA
jgi:hypothetical protein